MRVVVKSPIIDTVEKFVVIKGASNKFEPGAHQSRTEKQGTRFIIIYCVISLSNRHRMLQYYARLCKDGKYDDCIFQIPCC